jgi:hypothetical protein
MRFQLSRHAIERFRERDATCHQLNDQRVAALLWAEVDRGIPLGSMLDTTRFVLLPCGLVAVLTRSNRQFVVKTILTRAMAIGTLQARGVHLLWSEFAVLLRDAA